MNDSRPISPFHVEEIKASPLPEWSPVAVRLLQGVIYHDDGDALWNLLQSNISSITDYFSKINLSLVVDDADGMAYLRQLEDGELSSDAPVVPRLFRRTPLSYEATLLCVLLRDEFRQFEEHDVHSDRCIVAQSDLLVLWQAFFPDESDQVKLNKLLGAQLRKLEEFKFVRQFEKEPPSWEIRRILKARLPLSDLEMVRQSLLEEVARRRRGFDTEPPSDAHSETTILREEKEPVRE